MQQLIEGFSKQMLQAIEDGQQIRFTPAIHEIRNVVLSGSGTEGNAADLAASLTADQLPLPLTVIKNYTLPGFVNKHTLVIVSSRSGHTEETIAVLEQALAKNATVAAVTAGGRMLEVVRGKGLTLAPLPDTTAPTRTLLGFIIVQFLFLLNRYGLMDDGFTGQLRKAVELMDEREVFIRDGAQELAEALTGHLPILYGDSRLEPVLAWFRQQINQNAKQLAHVHVLPEMNYNELTGFVHPVEIVDKSVVVLVQTDSDHPRVRHRINCCRPLFTRKAAAIVEVLLRYGDSLLEQCLYLIHLFDWTSFYLAEQNGADVLDNQVNDYLQEELSKA